MMIALYSFALPLIENGGLAILFVIISLVTMLTFIIRLTPADMESCIAVSSKQTQPQQMRLLKNPFEFSVQEESKSSYDGLNDGINVKIKCDQEFYLLSIWGCVIEQLHNNLRLNCDSLRESIRDGSFLDTSAINRSETKLNDANDASEPVLIKPDKPVDEIELGQSPRDRYPLVVLLMKAYVSDDESDEIFAMVNIIHIRDHICKMETSVLSQLLLRRSGIINLYSLYTPETNMDEDSPTLCVVCQTNNIEKALIPCRHTVLCGQCLEKLDKCPLCRSYIHSFFDLKNHNVREQASNEDHDLDSQVNTSLSTPSLSSKIKHWFRLD